MKLPRMQTDDEALLTLSKWPFYLADILLVAAALAIAALGQWQVSEFPVLTCVVAVALGCAFFVLPFVVEYLMRLREEQDDRSSQLELLQAHLQRFEAASRQYHERLNELESGSGADDQRYELLASAVDHKLHVESQNLATLSQQVAVVEAFKAEQGEASAAMKAQLEALTAAVEQSAVSTEAFAALQAQLAAFEARLTEVNEPLQAMSARLDRLEEPAKVAAAEEPIVTPVDESRPARAPRQRRKQADAGLLHRAIQEKQDSASSAVSRIIDSKSKLIVPDQKPEPERDQKPEPEPDHKPELERDQKPEPERDQKPEPEPDQKPEPEPDQKPEPEPDQKPELERDQKPEPEPDQKPEPEPDQKPEPEPDQKPELEPELVQKPEPELDQMSESEPEAVESALPETEELVVELDPEEQAQDVEGDLFGEVATPAARRARIKAKDAILTVSILIGIGNKPFLRGGGGGLSWESGLPMDFEEIGKWRWLAPADLDAPIELQVYRNDTDADRKGRYTLEPGQKLEVSPVF